ncbi:MAG TPA: DNA mismatch repair protein MutS [Thermoanaerobaculia bacterium]|nr:DNA mismatch repair protein MutS [Thermoanaerobaculia bacterium]
MNESPSSEYEARLAARRGTVAALKRREASISTARLVVFGAGVLLVWFSLVRTVLPQWLPLVPGVIFLWLIVIHARTTSKRKRGERAAAFYEDGLDRIARRVNDRQPTGESYLEASHPYAEDLDLFGRESLFRLLSIARTRGGEARLASWLLAAASPDGIRARHAAIAELRGALDLREDVSVLGDETSVVDSRSLASATRVDHPIVDGGARGALRGAAMVLAAGNAVTLIGWGFLEWGSLPFLFFAIAGGLFGWVLRDGTHRRIAGIDSTSESLALIGLLLSRIERERFSSPLLVELRASLDTDGVAPSEAILRLTRLVDLLDARRNQFFAPIGALLLWTTQWSFAIESWKLRFGNASTRWLDALAEIEALSSLSSFSFEHPQYPFPDIVEGRSFRAEGIGHPLIPEERLVRNDVELGEPVSLLIVSGSNMSGKSTLLRSVGTNAVLALAGAPVCARRLSISPLGIGASIRIQDSLAEGRSRFFAEILRLRQIVELAEQVPLLFLLDEMLHGTNSHDRRIGAEAILRGLVDRDAIGLVTTHDLALADVTGALAGRARNVHFEDHIEDGTMIFDYRMRDGVVRRSNAIELMRSIGLDV